MAATYMTSRYISMIANINAIYRLKYIRKHRRELPVSLIGKGQGYPGSISYPEQMPHWRKSPLKPMLSAIWKLEITRRLSCLRGFPRTLLGPRGESQNRIKPATLNLCYICEYVVTN
jgi:hypothetical protein